MKNTHKQLLPPFYAPFPIAKIEIPGFVYLADLPKKARKPRVFISLSPAAIQARSEE